MKKFAILMFLLTIPALSLAECNERLEDKVDFAPGGDLENIYISVTGKSCSDAQLRITIIGSNYKLLYSFNAPISNILHNLSDKSQDDQITLIKDHLKWSLQNFKEENKEFDKYYTGQECKYVTVTKRYFEENKKEKIKLHSVQTFYEGISVVGFIPELNQSIEVASVGC